jgi:uncharacterized protein with PIN domain
MYFFGAYFTFYNELGDFLSKFQKNKTIFYRFNGKPSVKDSIEAIGIPHTEVEYITANGISVRFDYHIKNRDQINVYPIYSNINYSNLIELRQEIDEVGFVLDVHLGKLARLLRMSGFDTIYSNNYDDHQIARLAANSGRILLTRDRRLLKFKDITYGYWLRSVDPDVQLKEVLKRFALFDSIDQFKRCMKCNGLIGQVDKNKIIDKLEPLTKKYYSEFYRCDSCKQIYWKGSHYEKMKDYIDSLV